MNGPRGGVEIDWQELLEDVDTYRRAALRDPQQGVLDVQRLQNLRLAQAALDAAVREFEDRLGRCA